MTRLEQLTALRDRVIAAAGPDREIDAAIAKHVAGLAFGWCNGEEWTCGVRDCPGCGAPLGLVDERHSYPADWREDERLARYTASVDADLALCERVLPGWELNLTTQNSVAIECYLIGPDYDDSHPGQQSSLPFGGMPTCNAIVAAILDALIAKETSDAE